MTIPKFTVGDRLRVSGTLQEPHGPKQGTEFTVREIHGIQGGQPFYVGEGVEGGVWERNAERAKPEPKFKPGDIVWSVRHRGSTASVFQITGFARTSYKIHVLGEYHGPRDQLFGTGHMDATHELAPMSVPQVRIATLNRKITRMRAELNRQQKVINDLHASTQVDKPVDGATADELAQLLIGFKLAVHATTNHALAHQIADLLLKRAS